MALEHIAASVGQQVHVPLIDLSNRHVSLFGHTFELDRVLMRVAARSRRRSPSPPP